MHIKIFMDILIHTYINTYILHTISLLVARNKDADVTLAALFERSGGRGTGLETCMYLIHIYIYIYIYIYLYT
jgi:hypothetical protein